MLGTYACANPLAEQGRAQDAAGGPLGSKVALI